MPTYKLTYFNGKGRGETIRLCFAAADIKYEDKRVEFSDWGALKAKTPWGQLPVLEIDGQPLGQSMTIARAVARQGGLMGKDSKEQSIIESITDVITDVREKGIELKFKPEAEKAECAKAFQEKTLDVALPNLEKFAAANKDKPGCFVGTKISLADLHFFSIMEMLLPIKPDLFGKYPSLKKINDAVAAHPKVAEYLKRRPTTPF